MDVAYSCLYGRRLHGRCLYGRRLYGRRLYGYSGNSGFFRNFRVIYGNSVNSGITVLTEQFR